MGRENLRTVIYYTSNPNEGFIPGVDSPEKKKGYFHRWGVAPWKSPYDDSYFNKVIAVIEEENGQIIEIPDEWIIFES